MDENGKQFSDWYVKAQKDLFVQVIREMDKSKDSACSLVLATHKLIERMTKELVEEKCTRKTWKQSHASKLRALNKIGAINDDLHEVLQWFRKLRNRAAHEPVFRVTDHDLQRIGRPQAKDNRQFFFLCAQILGDYWNLHGKFFAAKFLPSLAATNSK